MLKASEIMTRNYLTISPDMGVDELARLFLREDVGGAVVVDKRGKLLGVVTESDLIAKEKNLHLPTIVSLFDAVIYLETSDHFKDELNRMVASQVEDIFRKEPMTILPGTTISDIATIMSEKRMHYLPVVENGVIHGVVGRREILKALTEKT
jgi:CBS domain-containing protein